MRLGSTRFTAFQNASAVTPHSRFGKRCLRVREMAVPERAAAPDLVFPQPRLALVHPQRRALGERRVGERAFEALLVERVAGLVERAVEGGREEVGVSARGDPHVVRRRERGGERVRRAVLASAPEVVAELARHREPEVPLPVRVEGAAHRPVAHLRPSGDGLDQRHEFGAQFGEDFCHVIGRRAGFVRRQKGVVAVARLAPQQSAFSRWRASRPSRCGANRRKSSDSRARFHASSACADASASRRTSALGSARLSLESRGASRGRAPLRAARLAQRRRAAAPSRRRRSGRAPSCGASRAAARARRRRRAACTSPDPIRARGRRLRDGRRVRGGRGARRASSIGRRARERRGVFQETVQSARTEGAEYGGELRPFGALGTLIASTPM